MQSLAANIHPTDRTPSPNGSTLYGVHFRPKSNGSPTRIPLFKQGPRPGQIFKTKFDKNRLNLPQSKDPKLLKFVHSTNVDAQTPNLLQQKQSPSLSTVQDVKMSKNLQKDQKYLKKDSKDHKEHSPTFDSPDLRLEALERESIHLRDSSKKSDRTSINLRNRREPKNLKTDVIWLPRMSKKFSRLIDSNLASPLLVPSGKKPSLLQPSMGRISVCQNASRSNLKSLSISNITRSFQNSEYQQDSIECRSNYLLNSVETVPERTRFFDTLQKQLL